METITIFDYLFRMAWVHHLRRRWYDEMEKDLTCFKELRHADFKHEQR